MPGRALSQLLPWTPAWHRPWSPRGVQLPSPASSTAFSSRRWTLKVGFNPSPPSLFHTGAAAETLMAWHTHLAQQCDPQRPWGQCHCSMDSHRRCGGTAGMEGTKGMPPAAPSAMDWRQISWHTECSITVHCALLFLQTPLFTGAHPIFHAQHNYFGRHTRSRELTQFKNIKKASTTLCSEIKSKKCFSKKDQFPNVTESDPTSSHADISDGRKKLWGRGNTLSWLNSHPVLCLMKSQPEERLCSAVSLLPLSSFPPKPVGPHHCHGYMQPGMSILICSVYIKELEAVAVWDPPDLWMYSKLPVPGLLALSSPSLYKIKVSLCEKMLCNGDSWNNFSLLPSDWAIENSKYLSQESFFYNRKMSGKTEVSFPSLGLCSRQAQKLKEKNKTGKGKKTPLLLIQSLERFLVENKLLLVGSKTHLGTGSLFLQEEVVLGYTWQQISIDIWLVLIWVIYNGIICVFFTCCEDSHCQMPRDGCRMQSIPQPLLRGHKLHITCGEEGSRGKWANN